MLDPDHESCVIQRLWKGTAEQVVLPEPLDDYLDLDGPLPREFDTKRVYHRFYYRQKAILKQGDKLYGVFTSDVSRLGVGLLAPLQLLPLDKATLIVPGPRKIEVEVRRCRRITDECYSCGFDFEAPQDVRKLLAEAQQTWETVATTNS